MAECNEVYLEAFHLVEDNIPNFEKLKKVITKIDSQYRVKDQQIRLMETYDPDFDYYKNIIKNADLKGERYLFRFGCYITENTIRIVKHLQSLPEKKIKDLADFMADAYERGFVISDKDMSKNQR